MVNETPTKILIQVLVPIWAPLVCLRRRRFSKKSNKLFHQRKEKPLGIWHRFLGNPRGQGENGELINHRKISAVWGVIGGGACGDSPSTFL